MLRFIELFVLVATIVASATAFSPAPLARVIGAGRSLPQQMRCGTKICMSADEAAKLKEQAQKLREEAAAAAGVTVEELTSKSPDGTVYDDEPMLEPPRENVSNAMKERLMREASTGLDSNASQTNTILYISVGVAILVLLGGQGILY
ncbi:hypothetical protein THAOC_02296 [Thalassiosira oceanica]|uniref:Uncharacterized protein n=1 Tax=Thalassiosira oceanica TaxID=159749 RepID=K0TM77_THAOC|nr:hypothetical protein THAOC_02296 [Thalassiosira oceanica]|eukprot:EJK75961.1 hypothetical protein THAOC_02296 [Thalassiosira oceanica]